MSAYVPLFRALLAEAASGTPATPIIDSVGGYNLTANYNALAAFVATAAGRGVQFTHVQGAADGAQLLSGSVAGLNTGLGGATEASWSARFTMAATTGDGTIMVLGHVAGGDGLIRLSVFGYDQIGIAFASEDADGVTQYNRATFYPGVIAAGEHTVSVVVDTTQAVQGNRARLWLDNVEITATTEHLIALNSAIRAIGANDRISIGTRISRANQAFQGTVWATEFGFGQMTAPQIASMHSGWTTNNDANALAPPVLAWTATPTVDQETASSLRISLTTNIPATVKIIGYDNIAQAQPSAGDFAAVAAVGTTAAYTVFRSTRSPLAANTERRYWVQISDGTTTLYASVNGTTLAITNNIIEINGGQPIRYNQASIIITLDGGATLVGGEVEINGVAQVNSVVNSSTEIEFGPLVWPAPCMYNETKTLTVGGKSAVTPPIVPAVGYQMYTLSGYVENPPRTIDFADALGDPDAVAINGDQYVFATEGGEVAGNDKAELNFGSGWDGTVTLAIVDSVDGTHSAFVTKTYSGSVNLIPNVPTLVANVPSANPGQVVQGSFPLAGADPGYDIPVAAAGWLLVAISAGGPWLSSITRQNGETVHYQITAGAFGEVRTGNVSMNGVTAAAPLIVTTRAANAPSITTQPANQSVTSGAVATYSVAATNAATYQWQKDTAGNGTYANISGATSATYARTTSDADLGTSNVRCIVTSSEGASTTSASATLTVIAAATRLVIPAGVVTGRGASMAGATAVPINIRNVNGALIHSTTVTIAASGVTNIDSNQNGAIGTDRFVGFPSSVDGSEALIRLTVQAAS